MNTYRIVTLCLIFLAWSTLSADDFAGFLPEDPGPANRVLRVGGTPLLPDAAGGDEAYWRAVSSGKHVPEFHFIVRVRTAPGSALR